LQAEKQEEMYDHEFIEEEADYLYKEAE